MISIGIPFHLRLLARYRPPLLAPAWLSPRSRVPTVARIVRWGPELRPAISGREIRLQEALI